MMCQVNERTADNPNGELVSYVEVGRGDVTVHNERVVDTHGRTRSRRDDEWMAGTVSVAGRAHRHTVSACAGSAGARQWRQLH